MKRMNFLLLLAMNLAMNGVFAADTGNNDDQENAPIIAPADNIAPLSLDIRVLFRLISDLPADQLPDIDSLLRALRHPNLLTDSEDSVYALVITYIKKMNSNGTRINNPDAKILFDTVRWYHISGEYFITVVRGTLSDDLFNYCSAKRRFITNKRPRYLDSAMIGIKCVFNNIRTWTPQGKYYSRPVLMNGYLCYYFLQASPLQNGERVLAGFLRVQGPGNGAINVLLKHNVTIIGNGERRFSDMTFRFTDPTRAAGVKLTTGNERWEDIIYGDDNDIVVNNTITVIVKVNFDVTEDDTESGDVTKSGDVTSHDGQN